MIPSFASRAGTLTVAASVAAVLVVATPVSATAAAPESPPGCEITGGTLSWGVKESFRSYISGSIANGSWETSDGAAYETPVFRWSDATGYLDPETGTGSVAFTGTLHFTGHDGVLDLTLANPTIEFEGGGEAALLLDARSTDMEGEVASDAEQERIGEVAVGTELAPTGGELVLTDVPTSLTKSGASAFAGFYEAGAELDPLTLTLEVPDCHAEAAPTDAAPAETPAIAAAPTAAAADIPWLAAGVGGAALLVIGFTVGLLVGGRRPAAKPRAAAEDSAVAAAGGDS